jgi:hypothetical protein
MTSIRTMLSAAVLTSAGIALVMPVVTKAAVQGQVSCNEQWLRGAYAFAIDGSILSGPAPVLLRGLAMTQFDGAGKLTQVDFMTLDGAPRTTEWLPATGWYQVNADCTGSAEIAPVDGSAPIRLRLVVFDQGRQVRTVVVGNATGSHGIRVD